MGFKARATRSGREKKKRLAQEVIDAELAKLPEPDRLAIELYVWQGLEAAVCAKRLGMSKTAFLAHFKRANADFLARLKPLRDAPNLG